MGEEGEKIEVFFFFFLSCTPFFCDLYSVYVCVIALITQNLRLVIQL